MKADGAKASAEETISPAAAATVVVLHATMHIRCEAEGEEEKDEAEEEGEGGPLTHGPMRGGNRSESTNNRDAWGWNC
jgi:hypothetical protein